MKEFKSVWHKVSEDGLPKTDKSVLVYIRSRSKSYQPTIFMAAYNPNYEDWCIAANYSEILDDDDEVIAWMEIPEYEG